MEPAICEPRSMSRSSPSTNRTPKLGLEFELLLMQRSNHFRNDWGPRFRLTGQGTLDAIHREFFQGESPSSQQLTAWHGYRPRKSKQKRQPVRARGRRPANKVRQQQSDAPVYQLGCSVFSQFLPEKPAMILAP